LTLAACARTEHVPVDLQVDVDAELPDGAEQVRLCISDGVARTFGAASGRYALTGLFPDGTFELTVDVFDAEESVFARVGPLLLEDFYTVADLDECEDCSACVGTGEAPPADAASWTLGARFL
jgi:hypothetical protein